MNKILDPVERRTRRLASRRKSYYKHREKNLEDMRLWAKNNKDKLVGYRKKNKFKTNVMQQTLRNYNKDDKCNLCSTKTKLEFHHWRYRKPTQMKDFSTLCRPCHNIIHRREK